MSNSSNSSGGGIGLFTLLGVAFIILKLCKVINWSWWLVTLPLWGGLTLVLLVIAIIAIMALIYKNK